VNHTPTPGLEKNASIVVKGEILVIGMAKLGKNRGTLEIMNRKYLFREDL